MEITEIEGSSVKDKPEIKATGFEDLDGDGNEIIDDALLLEGPDDDIE